MIDGIILCFLYRIDQLQIKESGKVEKEKENVGEVNGDLVDETEK